MDEEIGSSSLPKSQASDAHHEGLHKGKRKKDDIDNFFAPRTKPGSQPSLKSKAVDAIAAISPSYKFPSYHKLRVNLLQDCKEECKLGVAFLKSMDASDITKDAKTLCSLFCKVVEWAGPKNIVQLVTDNAANYKKARELLHERFGNICWSPCSAHCLNIIRRDFVKITHIQDLAKRASKVTVFVYNHVFILAWLRKREGWKEIIRPGATRFATTFITLKSLYEHKLDLQAFITSKAFFDSKLSKTVKGQEVSSIILDTKFWNDCLVSSKLTGPLIRLLRIMDSDEKPSMRFLYDGMYIARRAIKLMFKNSKRLYKPYTSIIKRRWDRQLRQGIHCAAYFLNPHFQYDKENFCMKSEVMQGLVELIGNKDICPKLTATMNEVRLFRYNLESFGKPIALTMAKEMQPVELPVRGGDIWRRANPVMWKDQTSRLADS
ncbi:uncharacterized protein LOC110104586 [Dendrobium catenatum]|uniref:uncharacterized protein LOC110104586 n=1 Tax=Dendrobium catenatum TaxID=906689 RepID=UPI0009F426F4|nr:uncharacterized protein LOC110104586 [Dendrobium catenatum]